MTIVSNGNPFERLVNPGVRGLTPYSPGKPLSELAREYGVTDAVKLASNENPFGPSPAAVEAAARAVAEAGRYPDGGGRELCAALGRRHGVDPAWVVLGNGSNELLELVARLFLGPGRSVVYARHAFAVYPLVTQAVGACARVAPARPMDDPMPLGHDLDAMAGYVDESTRLVFIANPNNPTGTWLDAATVRRFLARVPPEVVVVMDEAYAEYVQDPDYPDTTQWVAEYPNLMVTRTFSKVFGLAGLRIGYAVCQPPLAEMLHRVRQPFNTNVAAQAAALAALADTAHVAASVSRNRAGLEQLARGLTALGVDYLPSVCNFVCVKAPLDAATCYEGLLRQGVVVRPMGAYELPDRLRVTVGEEWDNERFLAALRRLMAADDAGADTG